MCLYRDQLVVVTSWTDAPISWPRCRPIDVLHSHPSLLVDEELARAIRHEAAKAICYWWRVSEGVVWRWRKALAVTRTSNTGSQVLIRAAAEMGAATIRGKQLPVEQVERRRRTAVENDFGARLVKGYHGPLWTDEQLALLGHLPDDEVAERTGRTKEAVRIKRTRRRIGIGQRAEPEGQVSR